MELTTEQKQKLYGLFRHVDAGTSIVSSKRHANSNVLIVDFNNTFLRCFSALPSMNENGDHTGGIAGTLKSIGYAIKLLGPTRCVVVCDGVGGSYKRKQLFSEYKQRRSGTIRLNRTYEDGGTATSEEENCRKQYIRLLQYLQRFPINLLSIDHVEADDVIAYLALDQFKSSDRVYIMSADRDFLQLCNTNVNVYSPTKKKIYGVNEVVDEYKVHPNNFVLYRSMDGDDSDNINGIVGAGLKTIVKHFPWLGDSECHTISEIVAQAENLRNKYKVCNNICENQSIIERNYALMQLKETLLTTTAQLHCNECLEVAKIPRLDRGSFFTMMREDMMENNFPNHVSWVGEVFDSLDRVVRA